MGWGTRYSVTREAGILLDGQQKWGKNTWVTQEERDYADNYLTPITKKIPALLGLDPSFHGMDNRQSSFRLIP
ncbi:MAG: hypothetical protein CM15mP64_5120 [Candidatus Neomarinimicrobiota bacterium]|nr:MAG: hypothetical protein CM15mP64_5120 [Candidatus Neomarinimicrobiota bacterium]